LRCRQRMGRYHWFVGVLLELHKSNSHDAVDVGVRVVAVEVVVAVEERRDWRRSHMHRFVTVDFLSHDIVSLQDALGQRQHNTTSARPGTTTTQHYISTPWDNDNTTLHQHTLGQRQYNTTSARPGTTTIQHYISTPWDNDNTTVHQHTLGQRQHHTTSAHPGTTTTQHQHTLGQRQHNTSTPWDNDNTTLHQHTLGQRQHNTSCHIVQCIVNSFITQCKYNTTSHVTLYSV